MRKYVVFTIMLMVAGTAGCIFGGHEIQAKFPAEGKKLAFVPFREKDLYFLESKAGADLAGLVVQVVAKEAIDTRIFDPKPAFDLILDKNPETIEWGKVAEKLKVDYVIVGNILLNRARDPKKDVNCFRGEMAVRISVWRPDNSLAFSETVYASYPSGKFNAGVVSFLDTTEENVLARLRAEAALNIARLFFPYTPKDD